MTDAPPAAPALDAPEQRRTLVVLVVAQIFSGAGLAAGITVGALLAQDILGPALSGLPIALFTAGSAVAALSVGRLSQRSGRRAGLSAGYAVGALGSLGVVGAAAIGSVTWLLVSLFVYGAGTATNLQARYAGADLAPAARRGRAVSTVLVATTAGAVVGPNLVEPTGDVAESLGVPALAGPFLLATLAYAAAALVLWVWLRPDPLLLARARAAEEATAAARDTGSAAQVPLATSGWSPAVATGAGIQVVTQLIMVAIMTMTPVHMHQHGHGVGAIGAVIAVHVAAMFLPSPLSGWLVDRVGRLAMAVTAAVTLLSAGLLAAWVPPESTVLLGVALVFLGLGWNLGLVSGTAVVADAVPLATRARTQGTVDLCIALAGAGGGLGSGLVVSGASYAVLGITGAVLGLLIIPLVALNRSRPVPTAAPLT